MLKHAWKQHVFLNQLRKHDRLVNTVHKSHGSDGTQAVEFE